MKLETVKICHPKNPDCFIRINQKDYEPDIHKLWVENADSILEASDDENVQDAKDYRRIELEGMDWRQLKAISEPLGIEKPGDGWEAAIDLILVAEFGENGADI